MFKDLFGNSITVAAVALHTGVIKDRDLAAVVLDQARPLEFVCGHCDSRSTRAQHLGE